jgi:hypothetical protein
MIKRDADGKVVEFEDEAAVAAMSTPRGSKDVEAVMSPYDSVLTETQARAEYEASIRTADAAAVETLKALALELGAEVAKLDKIAQDEKKRAKEALRFSTAEAERVRREKVGLATRTHQSTLEAIWARYGSSVAPINARLAAGRAEITAAQQADKDAALVAYKGRLAAINESKLSDAKVEAVASESLPAISP